MARDYKRIATEEAFMAPMVRSLYRKAVDAGDIRDPGFVSMWGFLFAGESPVMDGLLGLLGRLEEQGRPHVHAAPGAR